ncbi:MAG TPA: hypothetical protein VFW19_02955 [Allosphingosinicella sp.]|nr:hypothetical protein [Allosphingosinicella sp.]
MTTLTPYLLFEGNCADAMRFYHERLGGELTIAKAGESFLKDRLPPDLHQLVVNARLKGSAFDLSASDWMRTNLAPVRGNMNCIYFSGGTRAELKVLFDALSEGAEVTDPIQDLPFGFYGALNDKFGVRWMFHAD